MLTSDSEDVCWKVENNLFVEEETLQPIVTAIGDELPVDYEVVRDQMVTCSAKKTPLFEGYSVDIDNAHTQKYSRIVEESSETLAALDDKEMNQLFLVKRSFNDSDDDGSLDNNYVKRLASVEIKDLISGFEDVFDPVLANELPMNRKFDCAIDLFSGSKLPYGPIYKTTLEESRLIKEFLDENLSKGFIRHSISTISSPGFLVPKKDGSKRFVVNYGKLNDITVKVRYPLPLIDSILQQLSKATVFTSLDLKGAYNLVRMKPEDVYKTAFRTQFGLFESLVMPFGLVNAPAVFQQMMNEILGPYIGVFVLVYFDDILIFSEQMEDHKFHVQTVLQVLKDYKLYCKLSKCKFCVDSLLYLGFVISSTGIAMDQEKVTMMKNLPLPKSVLEVQQFLGFANYYRNFIKGYADLTKPFTCLLKKGVVFELSDEMCAAFKKLCEAFCSAPVLIHADPTTQFVLETDASDVAAGAVLSQLDEEGILRPVSFFSKQFNKAECNYDIYDRELLAVFLAFKNFRHLLQGSDFPTLVYTDHKNLEYFRTTKQFTPRQARWSLFFSGFDFKIIYITGKENIRADFLSCHSLL